MTEERHDLLGRSWSDICGWLGGAKVPVGARVRILPDRRALFHRHFVGLEAVVLANIDPRHPTDRAELKCRFVVPREQWDTLNYCVVRAERVDLVHLGDGQVIAGRDYELTELELAKARFAQMDLTYQDYRNAATFLAALYLRADAPHHRAVLGMVKANGRINPERLKNYFYRAGLRIDDWAQYAEGMPEREEFRLHIDWKEVAAEFEELAREQAANV